MPEELPYGRRRLVGIARAVASGPSIVMLDEPAAGLDEAESRELAGLIRRLADERGMGILLVEHDVPLVMATCDRIVCIDFGRVIASGTPDEVRGDALVVAAYLGTQDREEPEPAEPAPRASVAARRPVYEHEHGRPRWLRRRSSAWGCPRGYGSMAVVRDLDLHVDAGEVVALLGANGAGKTTTLLTLAGELPPLAGEVRLHGRPTTAPMHARCRDGLSFLTEERSVIMGLTVRENLRLADVAPAAAVELFPGLAPLMGRSAGLLSGGEQQMLSLARALGREPAGAAGRRAVARPGPHGRRPAAHVGAAGGRRARRRRAAGRAARAPGPPVRRPRLRAGAGPRRPDRPVAEVRAQVDRHRGRLPVGCHADP